MESSLFDKYEKPRENDGVQATSARQELINSIVDQMYTAGRPLTVEEKKHTAKRFYPISTDTLAKSFLSEFSITLARLRLGLYQRSMVSA